MLLGRYDLKIFRVEDSAYLPIQPDLSSRNISIKRSVDILLDHRGDKLVFNFDGDLVSRNSGFTQNGDVILF